MFASVTRKFISSSLPLHLMVYKAGRYAMELVSAPIHLRRANERGRQTRTLGRPRIANDGFLRIGDGAILHSFVAPLQISVAHGAHLIIGAKTFLNYGITIDSTSRIELGDRVLVGPYVTITDRYDPASASAKELACAPVIIEDDVWIGAKATIQPGVRIGRGAIVGVAAVVTEDVPPFAVVAGQPARLLKMLDPSRFVTPT